MIAGVWALVLKIAKDVSFILTPLPIIAVVMLAISVQFFLMGLLAELLVRTYHESQDKAIYAVREKIDSTNEELRCLMNMKLCVLLLMSRKRI